MDKVLKFFQIVNQIVWIGVGLATIYSVYWFITHNPLEGLLKSFPGMNGATESGQNQPTIPPALQNNPQVQKLLQQYSK